MIAFLVTGTSTRPCPILGPADFCLTKIGTTRPWLLLMSLALLTLGLLCVRPAHAQSGYPGGGSGSGYPGGGGIYPGGSGGGYWQPKAGDPVVTGTVTGTFTDAQGKVTTGSDKYYNYGSSPPPLKVNAGESLDYKVDRHVCYTWTWNGGSGNVPPPSVMYVHETGGGWS